jgi:hypothetical protein
MKRKTSNLLVTGLLFLFFIEFIVFIIPSFAQISSKPEIKTCIGNLKITSIEESDRFPPGCSNPQSDKCKKPKEKFKVLVVWLAADNDDSNPFKDLNAWGEQLEKVYVKTKNSVQYKRIGSIWDTGNKTLAVGFFPGKDESDFYFFWPGNPEINLGK